MIAIYHPEAENEMIATARYYENETSGLGIKFLNDLDETVNEIIKRPDSWITIDGDIRRHQFTHFPFAVLYRIFDSKIRILAIMNLHRYPN